MISEFQIRKAYYGLIQQFADDNNLRIIFPQNENDPEQGTLENNFIQDDYVNEELFLRPRIVSLAPRTLGIRTGIAKYKWIVQINVYARQGIGESDQSIIADQLRQTFQYGDLTSVGDGDKYCQQINNMRLESPVSSGTFIALPCLFTVQTFS